MDAPIASWSLDAGVRRALLDHAAAEAPREACGLLRGSPGRVDAAVPTANVAARPERAFEIEPAALLREHRRARGDATAIIGWYHSHPAGSGEPSRTDAARAVEDGRLWLIVADGEVHGWAALADGPIHGRFVPVRLD